MNTSFKTALLLSYIRTFMLINETLSPDRAKHAMSLAIISFTTGIGLAVLLGGLITQYSLR